MLSSADTAFPSAHEAPAHPLPAGDVSVAVCTFRRESVAETLVSLDRQQDVGGGFSIIVVDNDDTPTAQARVEAAALCCRHKVIYLHRPGRNISLARNACLDACETRWLAFLDDDETASPRWLATLLQAMTAQPGTAAIFGPVQAVYGAAAAAWLRAGDFHSFTAVRRNGVFQTGYTSNVLLDLHDSAVAGRRFDPAFGRTGGEDTAFFDAIYRAGGRLDLAPDAIVQEIVPPARASFGWLALRRFRFGQTYARLTASQRGVAKTAIGTLAKIAWCAGAMAVSLPHAVLWRRHLLRGIFHAGFLAHLLRIGEPVLYGAPPAEEKKPFSATSAS